MYELYQNRYESMTVSAKSQICYAIHGPFSPSESLRKTFIDLSRGEVIVPRWHTPGR
jgi:hypothetical protein